MNLYKIVLILILYLPLWIALIGAIIIGIEYTIIGIEYIIIFILTKRNKHDKQK